MNCNQNIKNLDCCKILLRAFGLVRSGVQYIEHLDSHRSEQRIGTESMALPKGII